MFEPPCAACRAPLSRPLDGAVCDDCWASVRLSSPLHERFDLSHPISWQAAVNLYEGRLKDIVHALKYDRRQSIAPRLGAIMRDAGAAMLADADCVVPVPLHPWREYRRGFNQAHQLAIHLDRPVRALLARRKNTRSQIDLPASERRHNVADAFRLQPSAFSRMPDVVVLVDDVATTGATLESCARVLRLAGVTEVRALTAARVVHVQR